MMRLVSTFRGFARSRFVILNSMLYERGRTEPKTSTSPAARVRIPCCLP
jgi:hypothetical protein